MTESGLPAGASGAVTFSSSIPRATICTIGHYPSNTSCKAPASWAAGTYTGISATFNDTDGLFDGSASTNTVSLTVHKAPLTVTAYSTSTTYGNAPMVTAAYAGFESGQGPGSLRRCRRAGPWSRRRRPPEATSGQTPFGRRGGRLLVPLRAPDATVTKAILTVMASSSSTYGTVPTVTATYAGFAERRGAGIARRRTDVRVHGRRRRAPWAPTRGPIPARAAGEELLPQLRAGGRECDQATLTVSASRASATYWRRPDGNRRLLRLSGTEKDHRRSAPCRCARPRSPRSVTSAPTGRPIPAPAARRGTTRSATCPPTRRRHKAPLTVTASSTSSVYGSVPTVRPRYTGFRNGGGPGSLSTVPTCSSTVTALATSAPTGRPIPAPTARRGTSR